MQNSRLLATINQRIEPQEVNRHHNVLYSIYLCSGRSPATSVRVMLERLTSRTIPGE